jgi:HlyD family secretion protein
VRKVAVKVGLSNGSVSEIVSGLKEGEQVVLQQ